MEDEPSNPLRRMSSRTRKVAPKMVAALASSDNRTQVRLIRLRCRALDLELTHPEPRKGFESLLIWNPFSLQAVLARLEALENDNAGIEVADPNDDDEASLDDDDDDGTFSFLALYSIAKSLSPILFLSFLCSVLFLALCEFSSVANKLL